jgi:hypothetical protein
MSDARAQPELPLEGPIPEVDVLPRLAAWLGRSEWSGHVSVRSGDVERRLYFLDGHVQTATSTAPAESLTSWLIETGLLGAESVEQAAAHLGCTERGLDFARKLVDLGMLSEADLADAELQRVVALAERILSLRSGVYRCEIGAPPTEMVSHALDVPCLVATAVLGQWDPTWAMNVLGGMGAVLRLNTQRLPEQEATGADEAYDLTLLRVDGRSSLGEVLERCPLPELAALRFLAACRLLGIVEASEARESAPARGRQGREPVAAQPAAPVAEVAASPSPAGAAAPASPPGPGPVEGGDVTTPGFYRRPASAPTPRAPEPVMTDAPARSAFGRFLLVVVILGLAAVVGWFGWVGLSEMSSGSGDGPPASEAAP